MEFFKNKQRKSLPKSEPRSKEDIKKEYDQTAYRAGNVQYAVYAYSKELEGINQKLQDLSVEANARDVLDKAKEVKSE